MEIRADAFFDSELPVLLVIDEDSAWRDHVSELLVLEGFAVLTAANGPEAMRLLELEEVDAVLADLGVRELEGVPLLRWIKTRRPLLPVFVMTEGSVDLTALGRFGARASFPKPLRTDLVARTILGGLA